MTKQFIILALLSLFQFTLFGQSDSLKELFPITGKIYALETETNDTLFIKGCLVNAWSDTLVIASCFTDEKGDFAFTFPTKYYENKTVIIKTNCEGFINVEDKSYIHNYHYPIGGWYIEFELSREVK